MLRVLRTALPPCVARWARAPLIGPAYIVTMQGPPYPWSAMPLPDAGVGRHSMRQPADAFLTGCS